jgi:hypothetical protein
MFYGHICIRLNQVPAKHSISSVFSDGKRQQALPPQGSEKYKLRFCDKIRLPQ